MDKWLNHPTAIKLMALTIGIIMWAVVHFDPDSPPNNVASLLEYKTIANVKVEPYGLDERNFSLVKLEPQTVNLTVRGTKSDLARKEGYRLQVDLRNVTDGKQAVPIRVDSLPRGVQLVEVSPSMVDVTVEALQTKEFEVQIREDGNPSEGYIAGAPIVKPTNRVHVTLPRNKMADVVSVGAIVSVEGETETIKNKSVKLSAFNADNKVIEGAIIEPAVVEVEVPITNPYKTVPLQFRMIGKMPSGLSIASFKPDVEQVTVYGSKEALDKIEFVEADVRLDQLTKSGEVTVPIVSAVPVTEIAPAKTVVKVEVVLSQTRTIEGLPINWKGLGDGLLVNMTQPSTGKVDITVKGAPDILNRLEPGDVQVVADLSGKGPGTHAILLIVNLPRFIEQAGGTESVTVEITADVPASAEPGATGATANDGAASADAGDGQGEAPAGDGTSDGEAGGDGSVPANAGESSPSPST